MESPEVQPVDILLVDDDANTLVALQAVLDGPGQNLVTAGSGEEALRCLLERDFALILLDIRLPGLDGFETAALIRARDRSRHTPIIFFTAAQHRPDREIFQGYALGAVDFLMKPVENEVLRSKVSVFVELHRKTEEVRRQAELLREAEQRDAERRLAEARQRWEAEALREEMEKERRAAEILAQKNADLARTIADKERAEIALRESNARLRVLADTANALLFDAQPLDHMEDLVGQLTRPLGFEVYVHYLVDDSGEELVLAAHAGVESSAVTRRLRLAGGASLPAQVAAERRPAVISQDQIDEDLRWVMCRASGLTACAAYPLLARDRLLGVLAFATRLRPAFGAEELAVFQLIVDQIAMALERAQLIGELRRRADALVAMDRRKDEFLAMLAHELRNPLAPILNALQLLDLQVKDNSALRRTRDVLDRQVRHLVRLVDDLLDVSRITSGKIELRRQTIDIAGVVEHALQISRPLIEARGHELSVDLPAEPVSLHADPTRVAQVIANLLNNAAKYTDPGGRIRLTALREDDEVVVRISDNGIGIAPELLPRVFDLFVQADRSVDRSAGGLGIGLTLVQKLVEMHGGRVTAHSAGLGAGSEFRVALPLRPSDAARSGTGEHRILPLPRTATAESAARAAGGDESLRILVVEDSPDLRDMMFQLLSIVGHDVHVAEDGQLGVELALRIEPQIAFLDIGLPKLNGYEVARTLRERLGPRIRLVAITGYGRPEDRRKALEAGFNDHAVKPVDLHILKRLLAEQRRYIARDARNFEDQRSPEINDKTSDKNNDKTSDKINDKTSDMTEAIETTAEKKAASMGELP